MQNGTNKHVTIIPLQRTVNAILQMYVYVYLLAVLHREAFING